MNGPNGNAVIGWNVQVDIERIDGEPMAGDALRIICNAADRAGYAAHRSGKYRLRIQAPITAAGTPGCVGATQQAKAAMRDLLKLTDVKVHTRQIDAYAIPITVREADAENNAGRPVKLLPRR